MARLGVGVEVAGKLLATVGYNPSRMGSKTTFAILCGSPRCLRPRVRPSVPAPRPRRPRGRQRGSCRGTQGGAAVGGI